MKFIRQWFQRFEPFFCTDFHCYFIEWNKLQKDKIINDIERKKNYLREFSIVQWKAYNYSKKIETESCQEDASERFMFTILLKNKHEKEINRRFCIKFNSYLALWSKNCFRIVHEMREVFAFSHCLCGKATGKGNTQKRVHICTLWFMAYVFFLFSFHLKYWFG